MERIRSRSSRDRIRDTHHLDHAVGEVMGIARNERHGANHNIVAALSKPPGKRDKLAFGPAVCKLAREECDFHFSKYTLVVS